MTIQKVRGTRDFFGVDGHLFGRVEESARGVFDRYGIRQIRTPVFEETSLFARSIGEATDIVSKEMYTFADRKGRSLTLRPEGTASVVRFLIEEKIQIADTLKLFYMGPMFRYERPQAGRYRQFHQFGIEYFGSSSPAADAETVAVGHALLADLGLLDSVTLLVNSLGCPECRPAYLTALHSFLTWSLSSLCDECKGRVETNPLRCLDCKRPECSEVYAGAPPVADSLCSACRAHDESFKSFLTAAGVAFVQRDRLVRGLDYYVRTVFEFVTSALGAQDAVIAGGRYDGLVRSLGGPDTPAVGFAGGIERIIELLKLKNPSADAGGVAVFVVSSDDAAIRRRVFSLIEKVRAAGLSVQWMLADGKSFKSQFRTADRSGAKAVIVMGEQEAQQGNVSIKVMATGEQTVVPESSAVSAVKEAVGRVGAKEDSTS